MEAGRRGSLSLPQLGLRKLHPTSKAAAAFTSKPKRTNGVEKKGLWSLSTSYTALGGHFFIIASCCSPFTTLSCFVLMYTRFTSSTSPRSSNRALLRASTGPGFKSIAAKA